MFEKVFNGDLPYQATEAAARWDSLYNFLFWLSVFFFILVVGGMIVFAIRYKASSGAKPKYITGSHILEAIFITIPTVLLLVIFGWGYSVYRSMTQTPSNAMEIKVIGKQWLWQFQYEDGKTTIGEVFVPIHKPVKFIMTSDDVIHSMFIPNFRVKQDVVPGMYTSVWFQATMPGKHQIFCTEYCGGAHSQMLGKVIVLTDEQWKNWKAGKKLGPIPTAGLTVAEAEAAEQPTQTMSLAGQGKKLFQDKGCTACHSVDGAQGVGPTLKGVFGHEVELADGSKAMADENYMRESIEKPAAKVVKGFQPVMPPFQGLLTETEMNAMISYIQSLK